MDGDLGKIDELLELAKQNNSLLLSDDAHGFGILQKKPENSDDKHIQLGTLSKAVGGYGGYVAGNKIIIDYLRNYAKSAIYSTALPPAILAGNLKSLKIIEKNTKLAKKTLDNACYFCELLGIKTTESAIIVIIIGHSAQTIKIANEIAKKGFLVSAIRPPTVEPNKSRLRITFSARHNKNQIKKLAIIVKKHGGLFERPR